MSPTNLDPDQLRDALRREAHLIDPIGLGPDLVQHRGRRRRNRGRSAIAVGSALCLAAVGVSVLHRQTNGTHVAFRTRPGSESAPTLAFRVVSGTVNSPSAHFTTADGVTYALSTAPGTPGPTGDPGQAIYSTRDGEHWTTAGQSKPWITDLSESDGVLYAIGTAPGATAADVRYRLGTSHDGGNAWSDADLPFDLTAPSASVPLSPSASVQVARGASQTAVLLTEQFWPDLDSVVASHFPGNTHVSTRQTADGFDMVDVSQCEAVKEGLKSGASPVTVASALKQRCGNPPVLGSIPWSEIGMSGPGDLVREQTLVSSDGSHWSTASAPAGVFARDLVATHDGFLLLADATDPVAGGARSGTAVYRSSDASHWTPVSTPAGLSVSAIDGDRIVGIDGSGGVQTSSDAGATWNETSISALLPAGAPAATASAADVGPLGFAVLVTADANPTDQTRGHDYLLFSTDGSNWSTSDLAANGEPAAGYPSGVTVGSDHVAVDYQTEGDSADTLTKVTTLLATPQR